MTVKHRIFAAAGIALLLFAGQNARTDDGGAKLGSVKGREVTAQLTQENKELGVELKALPVIDDLTFLRRIHVDLIGRIPSEAEIQEFLASKDPQKRSKLIEKLLADERIADTWTTVFADMLRLRSNAEGGSAAIAFVHQAVSEGMPYDKLARRFISANGKAGAVPEVGFILGDNADPMALAGATAQVFMGIRVACAQCHDHPFDKWKQEDFYGLAAFFGKTRRVETQFTNTVYTTEATQTTVLWPPAGEGDDSERKPMRPTFLFKFNKDAKTKAIQRLVALRDAEARKLASATKNKPDTSVDDLLAELDEKVEKATKGKVDTTLDVGSEAKRDAAKLNVRSGMYRQSDLRMELADLITSPNNRYFSRCFVNRVWGHLVGRGFVEPVDHFADDNPPSHPKTLDYLADEFVASGFDLKTVVRTVVNSDVYQRAHAVGVDELTQGELESAFLATPMRRMQSEVIYDSIITAGHLFDVKHPAGENLKTVWVSSRIAKEPREGEEEGLQGQPLALNDGGEKMKATKKEMKARPGYNLEQAIELDFAALLKKASAGEDEVKIERMQAMSKEEIEAARMEQQARMNRRNVDYIDRFVKSTVDDNPAFGSAYRMASPAAPEHFLRIFGQTDRTQLGEHRDSSASMRQALMMLNGRLTHEASRVGSLEEIHSLLVGDNADVNKAVRLAYREILTREPSKDEIAEAASIVKDADSPLSGMADLRWILLNCNEFRFLP